MTSTATATATAPAAPLTLSLPSPRGVQPVDRWADHAEIERRLEAHLLIARLAMR